MRRDSYVYGVGLLLLGAVCFGGGRALEVAPMQGETLVSDNKMTDAGEQGQRAEAEGKEARECTRLKDETVAEERAGEIVQSSEVEQATDTRLAVAVEQVAELPAGEIVRQFGWQEERGVWRYHTGIDIAVENRVIGAPVSGRVAQIEQTLGGRRIEVVQGDERWLIEPFVEVYVAENVTVAQGTPLGQVVHEVHIAKKRGARWSEI